MSEKILVPIDGSECSLRALDTAIDLARSLGDGLVICGVTDINQVAAFGPEYAQGCLEALQEQTDDTVKRAVARVGDRLGAVEPRVATGNVVAKILEAVAQTGSKWIVMGSHGRSGLDRLFMGSIAEGVLHRATVPVMVVPRQRTAAKAA